MLGSESQQGACREMQEAKSQGGVRDFGEVRNLDPLPRKAAGARSRPRSAASWAANERSTPRRADGA